MIETQAQAFAAGLINIIFLVPFAPQLIVVSMLLTFLWWAVRRSRRPSSLYGDKLTYGTAEDYGAAYREQRKALRRYGGRHNP
jgi:membrane protein implicated in regulation of membrane protease activity